VSSQQVEQFYDCVSKEYDNLRFRSPYHGTVSEREIRFVLSHIDPSEYVLEIGSGTGRFTRALAQRGNRVLSTDLSRQMQANLRASLGQSPNVDFGIASVYEAAERFGEGVFSAVVCMRVLPHLEDAPGALSVIHDVLAPGGHAIVDLWNLDSFVGLLRRVRGNPSKVLTRFCTYRQMAQMIESAGFQVKSSLAWGFPRIGRFSLDGPGNRWAKRFGYSVIFDIHRRG
jgi:2-polyprenyl-3-methyl-5-hydroxy-6-metoxy-1,4-benzoquinol methylase